MTELIYCYDGSFEGFLCCVFDSYANREVPTAICRDEDFVPTLFASRSIPTDRDHAGRVYRKVVKCSPRAAELLRHTATFGVRRTDCTRYALAVEREAVETPLGEITKKTGRGWGLIKHKAEFEDLASAARAGKVPLGEVRRAFEENA